MKKTIKIIVTLLMLAVALVMVLSLAACGEDEAAEPTAAPVETQAATEAPAEATQEPEQATATPRPTANAEGLMTFTSASKGFSFQYNQKYIAMANPADNAMVYAGGDVELPFCSVSLVSGSSAVDYLKDMAAGSLIELEGAIKTQPAEPAKVDYGERDIYYIYYTYEDKDAGGVVICAYYAENLADGNVVVYNSTALEGATEDVDSILKTAIESFKMD